MSVFYHRHDDKLAAESDNEAKRSPQYRFDWCPLQLTSHDARNESAEHQHDGPERHVKATATETDT